MSIVVMIFCFLRRVVSFSLLSVAALSIVAGQAIAQQITVSVVNTLPSLLNHHSLDTPKTLDLHAGVQGVVLYSSSSWRLIRHIPSGYIDVYKEKEGTWNRLEIALEWRRNTHPMLVMESSLGLFVVGYDVIANLPSGRRVGIAREGFDLYLLDAAANVQPQRLAENLQVGGIDTILYGSVRGKQIDVCGGNRCLSVNLTLDAKRRVVYWAIGELAEYDFVEVKFRQQSALALIRKRTIEARDARSPVPSEPFQLAVLSPNGVVLQALSVGDGTPWGVEWQGKSAILRVAHRTADFRAVLRYDLARMPFAGAMDFGSNNQEGRVAWSQVYYLQGLLSLLDAHPVTDASLREALKIRLVTEVEHTARLVGTVYPGLAARRYSIDREPLLFALHLGRVAHLLGNIQSVGITSPTLKSTLLTLQRQLLKLDETVEKLVTLSVNGQDIPTLAYRRSLPFWADGANVPHNYVSGYLSGILAIGGADATKRARELAKFILVTEFSGAFAETWRYWAATGDTGWKENNGVSLNTPAWGGNGGALAHITYHSMDAVALAQLQRHAPDVVPRKLINHYADLVARGWLLPFVNEELRIEGRAQPLNFAVRRYYSRSAAAWELQSQIAVLRSLANEP